MRTTPIFLESHDGKEQNKAEYNGAKETRAMVMMTPESVPVTIDAANQKRHRRPQRLQNSKETSSATASTK